MITKNFKNYMYCLLSSMGSSGKGTLPIKTYNNTVRYITTYMSNGMFPYTVTKSFVNSASSAGIIVGEGTTAPTEDDYKLESQITTGLSGSVVANNDLDSNGNPQIILDLTLTNTSSSSKTISEIGYQQNVAGASSQGATGSSGYVCLFDRTVLDTPVTIPSGEYAVIRYTLKTIIPSGE